MRKLILSLFILSTIACAPKKDEAQEITNPAEISDQLQGTWELVSIVDGGSLDTPNVFHTKGDTIVFYKEFFTFSRYISTGSTKDTVTGTIAYDLKRRYKIYLRDGNKLSLVSNTVAGKVYTYNFEYRYRND